LWKELINPLAMKKVITVFCILVALCSCNKSLENKDVEKKLSKLKANSSFSLDIINTSAWDRVYMLSPYMTIKEEKLPINISKSDQKSIDDIIGYFDNQCVLLFTKDNTLVSYSFVDLSVADFCNLRDYPSNKKFRLNDERKVWPE